MDWIANSNRFLKTIERGTFAIRKGELFSVDVSKQQNREMILEMAQALYCFPSDYPAEIEVRIEKTYNFSLPGVGGFVGAAGERRTLPRLAALYLISRFMAVPTDKKFWAPVRAPELSEEQVIKLYEGLETAEAGKTGNWVMRWRNRK